MDFLCPVCDRSIIENESEYNEYIATMRKKDDKSLYENYTIKNINLDENDKILTDYVTTHNKKFYFYLVRCEFVLEFDNNFTTNIQTNYCYNMDDITKIKSYLLYSIHCFKSRGFKNYIINQMKIKSISDRCNLTDRYYINQPMQSVERRINMIIAKNPQLINLFDRKKNYPLIENYSHITYNINI